MQKIISFPHMGNYEVPIENLLVNVFRGHKVVPSPKITRRTLELGSKHSPDFVCVPFKYTLGNFIEALENGANVLIQAGGGCRYRYYAEVQEQILRYLGYDFTLVKLLSGNVSPFSLYKISRKIGTPLSFARFLYYVLLAIRIVNIMDRKESYIRENIGFERIENSFENLHREFLEKLKTVRSFRELKCINKKYDSELKRIKVDKPDDCLKVGIVGELYTLMEPFSNFFIEKELAKNKVQVSRFINVTFLLFEKKRQLKKRLQDAGEYLKYDIGADGTDSVGKSRVLALNGYDGIIHLKPFGCTPEVNAMPMLQNIGRDYKIPVLYFSFDSQTSETGVRTRLEAFCDMIKMRKEKANCSQKGI